MSITQIISILAAVLFFLQVVYLTSKNKLHEKQAFVWIIFGFAGILVALLLPLLNKMASAIGVAYMPTLIFMSAFLVVLTLLINHTIVFSKQQEIIKTLVQEVAYLSKEVNEQNKQRIEKNDI